MKSVVPDNNHERNAGRFDPSGRSGHGRAGPGPGPDRPGTIPAQSRQRTPSCTLMLPVNDPAGSVTGRDQPYDKRTIRNCSGGRGTSLRTSSYNMTIE
jgi:hypothetical protein